MPICLNSGREIGVGPQQLIEMGVKTDRLRDSILKYPLPKEKASEK
jgi:hypothetical protein